MTESSAKVESAASAPSKSEPAELWLVNDDSSQLMIQERVLARSRFSVRTFASGLETVVAARAGGSPPLLVTDTNMPGMSGTELARFWLELHPLARVLIVSASTLTADQQREVEALPEESVRLLSCYRLGQLAPEAECWLLKGERPGATQPPPSAEPEPPSLRPLGGAFDPAAWEKLSSLGGEAFLRKALLRFVQGSREKMAALEQALSSGDRSALHSRAHALKGSAGLVGARELLARTERLEALTAPEAAEVSERELSQAFEQLESSWRDCSAALPPEIQEAK